MCSEAAVVRGHWLVAARLFDTSVMPLYAILTTADGVRLVVPPSPCAHDHKRQLRSSRLLVDQPTVSAIISDSAEDEGERAVQRPAHQPRPCEDHSDRSGKGLSKNERS